MIYPLIWKAAHFDPENQTHYKMFPAEVPGNIQYDYAVHHGFGNFQFSDHILQFQALEDFWWIYRTQLQYDPVDGDRVFFVAE